MVASTPLTPTTHPSGAFSPLRDLIRTALQEDGESSPDILIDQDQMRFLGYANRVVEAINQHPVFKDLLEQTQPVTGITCEATAGSGEITISPVSATGTLQFMRNTPLRISGAGDGGGDLITAIVGDPTSSFSSTGTIRVADEIGTTVTAGGISTVYSTRVRRYRAITEIREIDDIVMVDGLKYMNALDDVNADAVRAADVRRTIFQMSRDAWLQDLVGSYTALEIDHDLRGWDV